MAIAWLFPGQGTQHVGMGLPLWQTSARAKAVFAKADEALGWSLSQLCFEGPEEKLTLTENTQPAVVTASIAALEALREALPDLPPPTFVAGHSLGEYSALVATGALALEDAVRLVHLRGKAMQEAVPEGQGAMAAILGGDAAAVQQLCVDAAEGQVVSPANYNAPGQVVIAGHSEAVGRAQALAATRGLKAIPLKVSAPFHCALMQPAARAVALALEKVTLRAPSTPVVSNVTGEPNTDAGRVAELLVQQIDAPVLWAQSVQAMAEGGVTHALEFGSGKVLAGLVKRIDKRVRVSPVASAEDIAKVPEFLG